MIYPDGYITNNIHFVKHQINANKIQLMNTSLGIIGAVTGIIGVMK